MAYKLGVEVPEAVLAGPELVFVAIPPLFNDIPGSNVWAVLFFVMLIFLGIDTQVNISISIVGLRLHVNALNLASSRVILQVDIPNIYSSNLELL